MALLVKFANKLTAFRKKAVKSFLPKYQVEFIMYSLIPGQPVSKNSTIYDFDRGQYNEAKDFYSKTLESTQKFNILPSEVVMRKRKRVIHSTQFGPIKEMALFKVK